MNVPALMENCEQTAKLNDVAATHHSGVPAPMTAMSCFKWWIIPLAIFTNSALAQSTTSTIPFDHIAQYLQRDIFLRPGVGFERVQIGQSFDHVLQAWGQPQATRKRGVFRNTHEWFYGGGKDTVVSVTGKKIVSEIKIRGTFTTPFQTVDGARFGMAPHEIVTIYGRNADSSPTSLTYASRGVGFEFADGAVSAIIVAAPR